MGKIWELWYPQKFLPVSYIKCLYWSIRSLVVTLQKVEQLCAEKFKLRLGFWVVSSILPLKDVTKKVDGKLDGKERWWQVQKVSLSWFSFQLQKKQIERDYDN